MLPTRVRGPRGRAEQAQAVRRGAVDLEAVRIRKAVAEAQLLKIQKDCDLTLRVLARLMERRAYWRALYRQR